VARFRSPIRFALLAAILLSIAIISVTSYYWPIQEVYHPYNNGWNGCSNLLTLSRNPEFLYSYSTPIPAGTSLLIIIGPKVDFTPSETNVIQTFLTSGGIVLLADDFGTGNSLLENLNVSVRFSGKPISDLYFYDKQEFFPLISQFANDQLTNMLTTIAMSHPSYLEIRNPDAIKILAQSSPFSFIDYNGTGQIALNETTRPYPVIVSTQVGRGTLVLVSNAEAFANDMINLYDNSKLFLNILTLSRGTTAFDLAHIRTAPLTDERVAFRIDVDAIALSLQSIPLRTIMTAAIILGFTIAFLRRIRSTRPFATGILSPARNQAYIFRLQTFGSRLKPWKC
jgi:hypothetical protein